MAAALLVVTAVVARAYQLRLERTGAWVKHTNDVIQCLNEANASIIDLHTAERELVATGDARYLAQYEQASKNLPDVLEQARVLTRNNPAQQTRVARVIALSDKLLSRADDAIARARERRQAQKVDTPHSPVGPADERQRALRHEEREILRGLLGLTREMTLEENRLLTTRRAGARSALVHASATVLVAVGLALMLVIVSTWATTASIVRRNRAQREKAQLQRIVELQASREQNARLQERFNGILGHDLRTPLSAILLGASALQRRALPEADAKIATRIQSSAERMGRMINQLLDLTRVRIGGGIRVEPKPLDLAEVARRVVDELEMGNPERELHLDVEGEAWGEWDADRLAQVVANLVGNAIHHGASDEPVAVRVSSAQDDVVLSVHNGGEPIPAEQLPVIFEPFRRAKGSVPSGLGLGLFITQQIVLAHGGKITVVSSAAEGTMFTVTLPRRGNQLLSSRLQRTDEVG
jgi:signal transduction histidine kinase